MGAVSGSSELGRYSLIAVTTAGLPGTANLLSEEQLRPGMDELRRMEISWQDLRTALVTVIDKPLEMGLWLTLKELEWVT